VNQWLQAGHSVEIESWRAGAKLLLPELFVEVPAPQRHM